MFDESVNTYPHYNPDPGEFDFGLLAAYQELEDNNGAMISRFMDSYIGMMPTYRPLQEQTKAGKTAEPPYYILYLEDVAGFMAYEEGVITAEKLKDFISLPEGQDIRKAFRGYKDEYFNVEDAGIECAGHKRLEFANGGGRSE